MRNGYKEGKFKEGIVMKRLIDKAAIVAEINSRIDINKLCQKVSGGHEFYHGAIDEAEEILSFIDTLEVKEVDLEEELPISHSLTEEGLFTFEDGSKAIITKIG